MKKIFIAFGHHNTTGSFNSYGQFNAHTTNYGGQTYNISKPSTSNTIVCMKDKPAKGSVYDANFLIKSIGEKYGVNLERGKKSPVLSSPSPKYQHNDLGKSNENLRKGLEARRISAEELRRRLEAQSVR